MSLSPHFSWGDGCYSPHRAQEETNWDLPLTSSARKQQDLAPNLSPFDWNEHPSSITVQHNGERFPGRCDGKERDESEGEGRRLRWRVNKCLMSTCYTQACCQTSAARTPRRPGPPAAPPPGRQASVRLLVKPGTGATPGASFCASRPTSFNFCHLDPSVSHLFTLLICKLGQSGAHIINAEVDKVISTAQGTSKFLRTEQSQNSQSRFLAR